MLDPKTPGVYIEEISKLPASIAPVATAVPAFIGYTAENTTDDGEDLTNNPQRIRSLLEYVELFGGPFEETLTVTLSNSSSDSVNDKIAVTAASLSPYTLYYHVQMYFENGGGPCYIVSVGKHADTVSAATIDETALTNGLKAVEQEDEVTLLVIPEAVKLSNAHRKGLYDAMLDQCTRLQDRFSIFDVIADSDDTVYNDGNGFRNNDVGPDNLKYGAAYYPSLVTGINYDSPDDKIGITDSRLISKYASGATLETVLDGDTTADNAYGTIVIDDNNKIDTDVFVITDTASSTTITATEGTDFTKGANRTATASALATFLNGAAPSVITASSSGKTVTIKAVTAGTAGNSITMAYTDSGNGTSATLSGATLSGGTAGTDADKSLYSQIKLEVKKLFVELYPSATMAGVYARVDNDRGVWKAPANVSLRMVREPVIPVTHEEQDNLNVDASTGKSINAIRTFSGKGVLVWGSRTLAGNDNEWRYVPVRRLYIFVEESVKKATEFVVFEPNDAKTWMRVKTMIENFLVSLWKKGALAGAKPEDAFFVKVGLGETMTYQDILNGFMNIEIGMAAVRPAEFIILKFSHKIVNA
jgi:phage tail sheath protein FI